MKFESILFDFHDTFWRGMFICEEENGGASCQAFCVKRKEGISWPLDGLEKDVLRIKAKGSKEREKKNQSCGRGTQKRKVANAKKKAFCQLAVSPRKQQI